MSVCLLLLWETLIIVDISLVTYTDHNVLLYSCLMNDLVMYYRLLLYTMYVILVVLHCIVTLVLLCSLI